MILYLVSKHNTTEQSEAILILKSFFQFINIYCFTFFFLWWNWVTVLTILILFFCFCLLYGTMNVNIGGGFVVVVVVNLIFNAAPCCNLSTFLLSLWKIISTSFTPSFIYSWCWFIVYTKFITTMWLKCP